MTKYVCGPSWDRRLFDINPRGKVGLMITGGLDSWVLYNLLKHIAADIQLFTIKRVDGFDNPNRVRLLTGEDVIEIADTEIPNSQLRVTAGVDSILKTYDVDELYLALNRDPPIEHFPISESPSRRNAGIYKTIPACPSRCRLEIFLKAGLRARRLRPRFSVMLSVLT